jgi:REP element-mobilizing transposase RayT
MITVKLRPGLPNLRDPRTLEMLLARFDVAKERLGLRLIHFAILSNHMHFIVQAEDTESLSRGMQGLLIRIAKGLNKLWQRSGKVFLERFHARLIRAASANRKAFRYVLQNARKHHIPPPRGRPDPYSSGPWFRWSEYSGPSSNKCPPVVEVVGGPQMYTELIRLTLDDVPDSTYRHLWASEPQPAP